MDYLTEHADEIQSFMTKPGSGTIMLDKIFFGFILKKKVGNEVVGLLAKYYP